MHRLLILAPAAALALLSFAGPVSAQAEDLRAEVSAFRREVHASHRDVGQLRRCNADRDPVEIQRASDTARAVAAHADALAARLPGKEHVQMLTIRDIAEMDSWLVWTMPEICYQPPAE